MSSIKFYNVKDGDKFYYQDYPFVVRELETIVKGLVDIEASCKGNALVSYFRDHCLTSTWVKEHQELTRILTSRLFKTVHIEFLFESCCDNRGFQKGFEDYIMNDVFALGMVIVN